MDRSPLGFSVCGILQARILEWVAIPISRASSCLRDQPGSPSLQADSLPSESTPTHFSASAGRHLLSYSSCVTAPQVGLPDDLGPEAPFTDLLHQTRRSSSAGLCLIHFCSPAPSLGPGTGVPRVLAHITGKRVVDPIFFTEDKPLSAKLYPLPFLRRRPAASSAVSHFCTVVFEASPFSLSIFFTLKASSSEEIH